MINEPYANNICINFIPAIAEDYKNKGNVEYRKKDLNSAISFYTEGIKVNCKDDELNAKLYSNRAIAHFYLGEKFLLSCNFLHSIIPRFSFITFFLARTGQTRTSLCLCFIDRTIMPIVTPLSSDVTQLLFSQGIILIRLMMQELLLNYNQTI